MTLRLNTVSMTRDLQYHRSEFGSVESPFSTALHLCLPRHPNLADLNRQVRDLPDAARAGAEAIFLRLHPSTAARLASEAEAGRADAIALLSIRSRLPIFAVVWDGSAHSIVPLGTTEPLDTDHSPLLRSFRQAELNLYADVPGALLPKAGSFHYEGPSGRHYRQFLRVGSALHSAEALDGVAFWLQPYVGGTVAVVVDSASIAIVGLNLAQYIREENLHPDTRTIVSVQAMRGYDDDAAAELSSRLTAVARNSPFDAALLVNGMVNSGQLALLVRAAVREAMEKDVLSVALYSTPSGDSFGAPVDDVLSTLDVDLEPCATQNGLCVACSPGRLGAGRALKINPESYLLNVAQSTLPVPLDGAPAQDAMDFVGRYAGLGAFFAHRDEPLEMSTRRRHHSIYIDLDPILSSNVFQVRARDLLRRIAEFDIDLILSPNHASAKRLAELASHQLNAPIIVANPEDYPSLKESEKTALRQASNVLLVDDVVITGDRLRLFREAFLGQDLGIEELYFLVGVCRMPSSRDRLGMVNELHQMGPKGNQFYAVEEILLPHWESSQCPWCREFELLSPLGRDPEGYIVSNVVVDRHSALANTINGLGQDELFWSWNDEPLPLGPGSYFGTETLTEAEVYVIIASTLQVMRDKKVLDEQFTPPIAKVLDPNTWLNGRYYAPRIVAAVLRAGASHDLTAPVPADSFELQVNQRLRDNVAPYLRTEFLLAVAMGKLPLLDGAVEAVTDEYAAVEMLELFTTLIPGLPALLDQL